MELLRLFGFAPVRRARPRHARGSGPLPGDTQLQGTGTLSGQTTGALSVSKRRRVKLKGRSFRVGASGRTTVKLGLPRALPRLIRRRRTISLRLSARVGDPAGTRRTVTKRVKPKLKTVPRR